MRRVILLWVSVVAAAGQQTPPEEKNPLTASPEVLTEGKAIFRRSCTGCHGLDGAAGERGPALGGGRDYVRSTDAEIFHAVKSGIPNTGMPPSGLSETEIWKVVAYIRSLRAGASEAFVPGDVAHGERIFWNKGRCGACHMINGRGGITGPDLSNAGGSLTLAQLRGALTKPAALIPDGYQPVEIVMADGTHVSGVVKNEDNFSLQVLDNREHIRLLRRADLREVRYRKQSLMPADYDKTLSAAELQDLLAFLSRQARDKTGGKP